MEQARQLPLHAEERQKADRGVRLELYKKVNVAVVPCLATRDRAEEGKTGDSMRLTERWDCVEGYHKCARCHGVFLHVSRQLWVPPLASPRQKIGPCWSMLT